MEMNEQVASTARTAAQRLAPEFGDRLPIDVERKLHESVGVAPPDQYVDPVSVASLVVSIAGLAWTIYKDLRRQTASPPARVVARCVRVETPAAVDGAVTITQQDHLIDVVVEETIRHAQGD